MKVRVIIKLTNELNLVSLLIFQGISVQETAKVTSWSSESSCRLLLLSNHSRVVASPHLDKVLSNLQEANLPA